MHTFQPKTPINNFEHHKTVESVLSQVPVPQDCLATDSQMLTQTSASISPVVRA